ncbi:MAG: hypothetical protein EBU08_01040 [Micrococcales bacterium]|nr:hypothetical protein [Micrococcales bacterium]
MDETTATNYRRQIEDKLVKQFLILESFEGTQNRQVGQYVIKIEGRMNRKVNADKLQELAAANGLEAHLSSLFRWKPEIAAAAWKAADESITKPLLGAITTTPGRPTFTITLLGDE